MRIDDLPIDALASASPELLESISRTIARSLRVFKVPEPLSGSQWADACFYLSKESSYVEQDWKCWPFQAGMLDVMCVDGLPKVTIRKSARIGYTKMLLATIGYMAEHKRRNMVVYQPTDDDRDEFVTTEVDPMLRDVEIMRNVLPKFKGRDRGNTLRQKTFTTGMLHLRGGKAAKNYRRLTVDMAMYDEFSGFDRDIEKEGSPGKLGDKRLEGSMFPKSIAGSTPKIKYNDNTEDREQEADCHMRWHVPCAECGEYHQIKWGGEDKRDGLKWLPGQPETVRHICPHCGSAMSQEQYLISWHAGVWVEVLKTGELGRWLDTARTPRGLEPQFRSAQSFSPEVCWLERDTSTVVPKPQHVAMPIWTACAPQASWPTLVQEFLAAKALAERGDISLLKTFINTTLGETWEEKGETTDEHVLEQRAKDDPAPYALHTVPTGALIITTGVDVQSNRWEIFVWAWGPGLESWLVDYHIIEGNPSSEQDWAPVDVYLRRRYTQAWHGGTIGTSKITMDSGYETQAVYNFVRKSAQTGLPIVAGKGSSEDGKPILGPANAVDVSWRGVGIKKGIKVWQIGTDTAKDLLHGQLKISEPGPGYIHHPVGLPREYYEQLTAEQRITVKTPSGDRQRWIKRRPRNEALDGRNYAVHAAYSLGLHRWTDARWEQLRQVVQPPADLFGAAMQPSPAQQQDALLIPKQASATATLPPSQAASALQQAPAPTAPAPTPKPANVPRRW